MSSWRQLFPIGNSQRLGPWSQKLEGQSKMGERGERLNVDGPSESQRKQQRSAGPSERHEGERSSPWSYIRPSEAHDYWKKMSRNVAAVEKEIMIKNALVATRASYQPPPLGNSSLCHAANPSSSHLLSCIRAVSDAMDINEVYPNVFISDETTARNKTYLVAVGITHVVNAAEGHLIGFVNTSSQFYQGCGISYKGVNLADLAAADASRYFKEVSNFIDNGLKVGGKVLVHCVKGISRSGTLVLAFLMMKRDMTAVEAMTTVRHKRNIRPNGGFIHQLAKLDNKLVRKRRKSASPDPSSLSKP